MNDDYNEFFKKENINIYHAMDFMRGDSKKSMNDKEKNDYK